MTIEIPLSFLIMVGTPVLAGVVWLVRLEGRVNGHQQLMARLAKDVTYIRDRFDDWLDRDKSHP